MSGATPPRGSGTTRTPGRRGGDDADAAARADVRDRPRRVLTTMLAAVWLLDAALQYQPYMFTASFPRRVIEPAGEGSPPWVHGPVEWSASVMAHHIVLLNAAFATVQLLIAIGLFWPRTVRVALAESIVWSLMVWWLGEGLGGILAGPVSPLAGLPGAVLLYAVIALLVWPPPSRSSVRGPSRSVATGSPLRTAGAVVVWLALWLGFAVETLLPGNRAPSAVHDLVGGMADGQPRWMAGINRWAAGPLAGRGVGVSIALAVTFVAIGACVLVPSLTRAGIAVAVALSLVIWVVAQDFGAALTGQATDPNSGPLLALLALCYWPLSKGERTGHRGSSVT